MSDSALAYGSTSRSFRNAFARNGPSAEDVSVSAPSNFAKVVPGQYGRHVSVGHDGTVHIAPSAYPDDVVAVVLGFAATNPTLAPDIKVHLARFLDAMDERAMVRLGYSASPTEAAHQWTLLATKYL